VLSRGHVAMLARPWGSNREHRNYVSHRSLAAPDCISKRPAVVRRSATCSKLIRQTNSKVWGLRRLALLACERTERFNQWAQVLLVVSPLIDGSPIDGLPHLPLASRTNRPLDVMEVQTT